MSCRHSEHVDLYFYGELGPADRAETAAHLDTCAACRQTLADLQEIERVLGNRLVDAPPAGGWSAFAARLDARIGPARSRWALSWMQAAAALILLTAGAFGGWAWSRAASPGGPAHPPATTPADTAIAERGGSELERARLVLAGIAAKSDGDTWALERDMAARLLPDVTLIRQAASLRRRAATRDEEIELGDILLDVETLLLQASYAAPGDTDTLARLRAMIERRDLLMRLSLAASGKPKA